MANFKLPYFNGTSDYTELADADNWSITSAFSMSVSVNPSVLTFPNCDGASGDKYVNFLSKLDTDTGGQKEWAWRMYSADNTVGRENRISFYVFTLANGGYNTGAFVQETVTVGEWIDLVVTLDGTNIRLYKNGVLKKTNPYTAANLGNGHAPVRIGTGMHANNYQNPSYFEGYIDDINVFSKVLSAQDALDLHSHAENSRIAHWDWRNG